MLKAEISQLLIIDIQERLAPAVHNASQVIENTEILMVSARRLGIPVLVSEQYPQGLGFTVPALRGRLEEREIIDKICFSAFGEPAFKAALNDHRHRKQMVICGMEAHICVQQTALELRDNGYEVAVVADAASSRNPQNAERAYSRMGHKGLEIVTTEMVLFEWMREAANETFRELSKLIK